MFPMWAEDYNLAIFDGSDPSHLVTDAGSRTDMATRAAAHCTLCV